MSHLTGTHLTLEWHNNYYFKICSSGWFVTLWLCWALYLFWILFDIYNTLAWLPPDVIYLHYTEILLCLTMVSVLANEHR